MAARGVTFRNRAPGAGRPPRVPAIATAASPRGGGDSIPFAAHPPRRPFPLCSGSNQGFSSLSRGNRAARLPRRTKIVRETRSHAPLGNENPVSLRQPQILWDILTDPRGRPSPASRKSRSRKGSVWKAVLSPTRGQCPERRDPALRSARGRDLPPQPPASGGRAGDQPSASVVGHVRPGPREQDHEPVAEPDQEENVDEKPGEPGAQPRHFDLAEVGDSGARPMVAK